MLIEKPKANRIWRDTQRLIRAKSDHLYRDKETKDFVMVWKLEI